MKKYRIKYGSTRIWAYFLFGLAMEVLVIKNGEPYQFISFLMLSGLYFSTWEEVE